MDGNVTVRTDFGPVDVTTGMLELWNTYGWPTDEVLRRMVAEQAARRAAGGSSS